MPYTRRAVRERAARFPDELSDIQEEIIDKAEGSLHSLLESSNDSTRLKAVELVLKTKGRNRGYVEKVDHDVRAVVHTVTYEQLAKDLVIAWLIKGCSLDQVKEGLHFIDEIPHNTREAVKAWLGTLQQNQLN